MLSVLRKLLFSVLILDEHLTGKSHINNVAREVSKAIGIIYKSSFCLNNSSLRILYFSLIYPYLFYCVSVWASTHPLHLRRLITLQKRVVRITSRSAFDAHTKNSESREYLQTSNRKIYASIQIWLTSS